MPYLAKSYDASVVSYLTWKLGVTFFWITLYNYWTCYLPSAYPWYKLCHGPDLLHPLVLKNFRGPELPDVFDILSVYCGRYSSKRLEEVDCNPLFKKGSRYDPLNYRPVSLTSVCCKTLERIVTKHIHEYLESNAILSDHQFGFRPGRSVVEQLLLVYNDVSSNTDAGQTVDLVLFDYSKAFDVVCHNVLLEKLQLIGIDNRLLEWISSFLSDKVQFRLKMNRWSGRGRCGLVVGSWCYVTSSASRAPGPTASHSTIQTKFILKKSSPPVSAGR